MILIRRLVAVGTSLGITLPRELLRERGYKRGDSFFLDVADGALTLRQLDEVELAKAIRAAAGTPAPRRRKA